MIPSYSIEKVAPFLHEKEWISFLKKGVSYDSEKISRQKYYQMWLLVNSSELFISMKQYVTIVSNHPGLLQNY